MKDKGSAQVVEMSFVLPVAMIIVLALVYLAFGMFFYGHTHNLARISLNSLCQKVGDGGMYWQLLGDYIDEESLSNISNELSTSLKNCSVLPGLKFDSSCTVTSKLHQPIANVFIRATYFGKQVFTVEVSKVAYKPYEFACVVDFGHTIEKDFEKLKGIYDAFF